MFQALTYLCVQVTSTTTTVTARTKTTSCQATKLMTLHVCPLRTSHVLSQFWHAKIGFFGSCRYTKFTKAFSVLKLYDPNFCFHFNFFCRGLSLLMTWKCRALPLFWNCTTEMAASHLPLLHRCYYMFALYRSEHEPFFYRRGNRLWYNRW